MLLFNEVLIINVITKLNTFELRPDRIVDIVTNQSNKQMSTPKRKLIFYVEQARSNSLERKIEIISKYV